MRDAVRKATSKGFKVTSRVVRNGTFVVNGLKVEEYLLSDADRSLFARPNAPMWGFSR